MAVGTRNSARGRPAATTHDEIERAAFRLFEVHGFAGTTLDDIAAEVGVGRRTVTRYYPSKNDIPWGQFATTLDAFAALLDQLPRDLTVAEAVHQGVLAFNDFPASAHATHRERMRLILTTPELQAHSVLQYTAWRDVIARFVARRLGTRPHDVRPQVVAQTSLAIALTAYDAWLADDQADLLELLDEAMGQLRTHLADPARC